MMLGINAKLMVAIIVIVMNASSLTALERTEMRDGLGTT